MYLYSQYIIVGDVRDGTQITRREMLLNLQDIANIAVKFKCEPAHLCANDKKSVGELVLRLKAQPDNPIFYYNAALSAIGKFE